MLVSALERGNLDIYIDVQYSHKRVFLFFLLFFLRLLFFHFVVILEMVCVTYAHMHSLPYMNTVTVREAGTSDRHPAKWLHSVCCGVVSVLFVTVTVTVTVTAYLHFGRGA